MVGNRSSKEKRNERESGGVDGARARRNSLGIVNFRCNVISIRVFRMNYWPVPLIPSGGYIWYSLLQATIRSILRQVYPSGGSIISCIFYPISLLFAPATCFHSGCATTKNRWTLRKRSKKFRVIMFNSSRQDKEFSFFIPIGIREELFNIISRRTMYYDVNVFSRIKDFFNG